ncbi:MAG: prepilin peptidase [Clostridiales bacterium]|jgi:Flp pilus assembly protein protease CpaA|nr:prepilin peptidase [Clostridiales bacterium]
MAYGAGLIIRIAVAAVIAVIFGNGSVVAFNRLPARWFEDYDEADSALPPDERRTVLPKRLLESDSMGRQRLPSTPWKYAFTGYFALCGLYLAIRGNGLSYEISVLCVLFIVLMMAIADQMYKVVPDQFSIMLAVSAAAFVEYHDKWWEPAAGAALGLGVSLAILLLGNLLFGAGSLGGADIKFFACMGLVTGRIGIAIIFILTTFLFAAYSVVIIAGRRGSIKDRNAMLPSACAASTIYFLFLWNIGELLVLEL